MPHDLDLVLTLAGGFTAALVLGFITQKLKLSPIVGYLFAGVVVGPFTPGFVAHVGLANQLAEIGIILLMFEVGLHFQLKELLAVRKVALPGAMAGICVATALGTLVAQSFGWSMGAGVVFGLTIAIASTVVMLRVLADNDALQTRVGHIAVGWLVVEDLFTVLALVLLPLFAGGGAAGGVVGAAFTAVAKVAALVTLVLVVGRRAVPVLLGYVAKTRSRELFTLTVLVLALGIAVGSAKAFGVSMALGAFLGGMAVGQSDFGARAASEALPMRDAFAVLFFVSIGMLFDPSQLTENAALSAATLAVVLFGKPFASYVVVRVLGHPVRTAAFVAVALAQIGEFSFVVAALGRHVGLLPERATQALVVTAIVSITLNPVLFRWAKAAVRWAEARAGSAPLSEVEAAAGVRADGRYRAIVVGYGPVGRTVTRLLRENEIEPTVVELNHETVAELRAQGVRALYGDASQREILEQAGVRKAMSLIFAASGTEAAPVIRMAKEMNPELTIVARAAYVREMAPAKAAGADAVIASELEVALAMTERLLVDLGATVEQLDRARERVRRELAPA